MDNDDQDIFPHKTITRTEFRSDSFHKLKLFPFFLLDCILISHKCRWCIRC